MNEDVAKLYLCLLRNHYVVGKSYPHEEQANTFIVEMWHAFESESNGPYICALAPSKEG